jgi:hypothetical protein
MAVVRRKVRLVNPRRRRRRNAPRPWSALYRAHYKKAKTKRKRNKHRRRRNVGEIITLANPGGAMKRRRRRRHNPRRRHRRVLVRNRVVVRYRRRRRNPFGFNLTEKTKQVLGILAGATATKLISERLPYGLNSGLLGYVSAGVVAAALGYGTEKFAKDRDLGEAASIGGFVYVVLRVLQDFFPSLASVSSVGLRGVGAIMPSQGFFIPTVPQPGSMTQFVPPGIVTANAPNTLQGLNAGRRLARVR